MTKPDQDAKPSLHSKPSVHVVGLGPGGPDLITAGSLAVIDAAQHRILRTSRHPAASVVSNAVSCDDLYESEESFDAVYAAVVERVVASAREHGEVVYIVPGSPRVAERGVEMLAADERVTVTVHAALSFIDLAWVRLGVDPLANGVRVVDGRRFAIEAAGETGPLLVAQCDQINVLSDIKLSIDDPGDMRVTVIQRLGLEDEAIFDVAWNDMDREVEPDHLTSLWIPEMPSTVAAEFARFDEMVIRLRADCPWDAKQTHDSLRRYLLEETYEVLEAIDGLNPEEGEGYADLEEELGDVLYQIFFHAILATEAGQFTVADVARNVHDKLYERHPHVYGDVDVADDKEVLANWEANKKVEKGRDSIMDGIPAALPALLFALKVQKKAASQKFGLPSLDAAFADVDDELAEAREDPSENEVGDLLFAAVQVARQLDLDPETALRDAAQRFVSRFKHVETAAGDRLSTLTSDEQHALWADAKAAERSGAGGFGDA